jgi:antitoxin (DNA-binding transcriptional repressor) of toxin-antitoxin stability system
MPEIQTITATHFRENLSAVLESVLLGKTVHVVRNGRPLCTVVPPVPQIESTGTPPDVDGISE